MNIKAKLQDAVNALNYGSLSEQNKKEDENCSYRIKQTKNRKTIVINCRECDSESSLNDIHCRKNIFRLLQKKVHADCLVLSRLYERDCWDFDLPAYFFSPLQENKGPDKRDGIGVCRFSLCARVKDFRMIENNIEVTINIYQYLSV